VATGAVVAAVDGAVATGAVVAAVDGAVATGAVVAAVDGAVATGATVNATQINDAPEYWYEPGYPPAEQAIPGEIDPPVVGAVVTAVGAAVVAVAYGMHAMFAEPPAYP
jgi:hypothetical protein